jgi:hypothetical protein
MTNLNEWLIFAQTKQSILDDPSLKNLLDNYERLQREPIQLLQLKKLLAEICFLMAQEYKSMDQLKAYKFAQESMDIYKFLQIDSLEDAEPVLNSLLPDLMHEGVVQDRILKNLKK